MVTRAWGWKWSSARYHTGKEKKCFVISGDLFDYVDVPRKEWEGCLRMDDDEKSIDDLRKFTKTGLPLGKEGFIKKLEAETGRVLSTGLRGRPLSDEPE